MLSILVFVGGKRLCRLMRSDYRRSEDFEGLVDSFQVFLYETIPRQFKKKNCISTKLRGTTYREVK